MSDLNQPTRYFRGLQQGAFMRLEHAASLKGLLKPFNRPLKNPPPTLASASTI